MRSGLDMSHWKKASGADAGFAEEIISFRRLLGKGKPRILCSVSCPHNQSDIQYVEEK